MGVGSSMLTTDIPLCLRVLNIARCPPSSQRKFGKLQVSVRSEPPVHFTQKGLERRVTVGGLDADDSIERTVSKWEINRIANRKLKSCFTMASAAHVNRPVVDINSNHAA
jgi:hypothetical protein